MWCSKCHYGSETCRGERCPQCGGKIELANRPFPDKPVRSIRAMWKRKSLTA